MTKPIGFNLDNLKAPKEILSKYVGSNNLHPVNKSKGGEYFVASYNFDGKLVKIYDSMLEAALSSVEASKVKDVSSVSSGIRSAAVKEKGAMYGYLWRVSGNKNTLPESVPKHTRTRPIGRDGTKIAGYSKSGISIGVFDTAEKAIDAAKDVGVICTINAIRSAANRGGACGGIRWRYVPKGKIAPVRI